MEKQEIQDRLNSIWKGWDLKEQIGEGSYGKVYSLERKEFGHVYRSALKVMTIPQSENEMKSVINDGMDEDSAREYFYGIVKEIVEEFTLMSRLKGNTNIVSYEDHAVLEVSEGIGWNIFIRMELLTPVLDYYRNNTTSVRDIVKLGIDICQALEICEQYNIIHRDVKPGNIFVSELGNYKLGDFGIAKQLEKTSGSLSRKGTINYMAPEVYKGDKYDQTVDIYSLGLVLYRFLNNNRMPFVPPYPQPLHYSDKEESNIKRMKGVQVEPPCNAHGRLAEIVIKACAFDSDARYSNASDMKQELIDILKEAEEKDVVCEESEQYLPEDNSLEENSADVAVEDDKTVDLAATATYISTEISDNVSYITNESVGDGVKETINDISVETSISFTDEMNPIDSGHIGIPSTHKAQGSKKWLIVLLILILMSAGGVAGAWYYNKSTHCLVPNVEGMPFSEAKTLTSLDEYMLEIEQIGEDYSDSIKKGGIIYQSIESGTTVKKGTVIEVIVSKGARIKVPGLVGINTDKAESLVTTAGLKYNVAEEVYSDDIAVGIIISQDIEEGTEVDDGQTINVIVSKGKELITVPNLTGVNIDEAVKTLTDNTLIYEIKEEYSDTLAVDTVISQDIAEGEMVEKNTKITLVKSIGKKPEVKVTTPGATNNSTSKSSTKSNNSSKSSKKKEIEWEVVD